MAENSNRDATEAEFIRHNEESHDGEFDFFDVLDDDNNKVGLACDCGNWVWEFDAANSGKGGA